MGDEAMPADPFREGQPDFGQLAALNFGFWSAHVAAGFKEDAAMQLTTAYMSMLVASAAAQSSPGEPEQM